MWLIKEISKNLPYDISLEEAPKGLGDFAIPCFKFGGDPKEIAKEIASKINSPYVKEVKVAGPYVNLFVDKDKFANRVVKELKKPKLTNERILVEYFQPNTHKAVHIGHGRNLFIGESISRILEFAGAEVVRATYGGDIGPHVAKCIWAYMRLGPGDLGKLYAYGNEMYKKDENAKKEIIDITKKLYNRDKNILEIWKTTRKQSINHIKEILKLMNVKMDKFYWESEVEKEGLKIVDELLKKGLVKKSDGAIIADLGDLGVVVLVSKEGYPLYPAKDLGLAKKEFKEAEKVIHVVGVEQELYFKQLFKLFDLIGWDYSRRSIHKSYELVDLKNEKMSSRLGNIVKLDELYQKMVDVAKEEIKKRGRSSDPRKIALAALKFGMLNHNLNKKILFDYKDWLSFEGDTGPYIQYSYVRAINILKKDSVSGKIKIINEAEHELIKEIYKFSKVFNEAFKKLDPPTIAHYSLTLANKFNKFYECCPAVGNSSRISIVKAFKWVMEKVIYLLGIEPIEKM